MMINCLLAFLVTALSSSTASAEPPVTNDNATALCPWPTDRKCPDPEVRFYLYTRSNVDEQQLIHIDDTWEASNLSTSFFNPREPSKIIIHGFRADMYLTPLFEMKTGKTRCAFFGVIKSTNHHNTDELMTHIEY